MRAIRTAMPACLLGFHFAAGAHAQGLTIPHPDGTGGIVEYFVKRPQGIGAAPAVMFVHGHQEGTRPGAEDFVSWGVLERYAQRGYLAVAVSQPGYGRSSGPPDFCGPRSQDAVRAVLAKLVADGNMVKGKTAIVGISRGALVAGLVAAADPSIGGIVLISGLFDLPRFAADAKSVEAKAVVQAMKAETGGGDAALRARSVMLVAPAIRAKTLILNGGLDDRTSPAQARLLAERINASGGSARAVLYPEFGHQIPVHVRDRVVDPFLDSVLRE